MEEGAEAQSASVGGLDTRQGEDEGESSSRDAGIKAASWWVSGVGTEVSVKVSSARLLLFLLPPRIRAHSSRSHGLRAMGPPAGTPIDDNLFNRAVYVNVFANLIRLCYHRSYKLAKTRPK